MSSRSCRQIRRSVAVAAIVVVLTQAGCVHLPASLSTPLPASFVGRGEKNPRKDRSEKTQARTLRELPDVEAAAACVVAADMLEKSGRDPEAAVLCERARKLDPKCEPEMTRRLATLYGRLGQFDRAKSEFNRALARTPNDPDLLNDLGYFYYSRGLWTEAEGTLRKAVAQDSAHERAWINLGMALGQQGRYPESLEAFKTAVSTGKAYCNLGFIFAVQGKRDDARNAYRLALLHESDLQLAATALDKLNAAADRPASPPPETSAKQPPAPAPSRPTSAEQESPREPLDREPLNREPLDAPIELSSDAATPVLPRRK